MKQSISCILLGLLSCASYAQDNGFDEYVTDKSVIYKKADGTASAELSVLDPIINIPTTKDYAQYVMDSYQGWDLKPVIDLRGFSFKFVDNAPCSGLVTYYDGRSYLLFKSCGVVSSDELKDLFSRANEKLKLRETLKKQARPNLY